MLFRNKTRLRRFSCSHSYSDTETVVVQKQILIIISVWVLASWSDLLQENAYSFTNNCASTSIAISTSSSTMMVMMLLLYVSSHPLYSQSNFPKRGLLILSMFLLSLSSTTTSKSSFLPTGIFASAEEADGNFESELSLQTSKLALFTRQRRRKLFQNAIRDHYQGNADSIKTNNNTNDHSGNSDSHIFPKKGGSGNNCLYYNTALDQEKSGDRIMSEWTIEFCPGWALSKLKLTPLDDVDDGREGTSMSNTNTPQKIKIEDKSYAISDVSNLGNYIEKSMLTNEEYQSKIHSVWGDITTATKTTTSATTTTTTTPSNKKKDKQEKTSTNDGSSSRGYYANGDTCKSRISGIDMKHASIIHMVESCCSEEQQKFNYFHNQRTTNNVDSSWTIYKMTQTSNCRYSAYLCRICDEKTLDDETSTAGDDNNDDTTEVEEEENSSNILDLFLHLPDEYEVDENAPITSSKSSFVSQLQSPSAFPPMPPSRIKSNMKLLKSMFQHAYDSYMYNAYPASELKPKSCSGGMFHLIRLPALTLIDSLDMLLIMGNHTEFARSVERLRLLDLEMQSHPDPIWKDSYERGGLFAVNQNVSVFETNIRVLGGLLSAHQMAETWMKNEVLKEDIFEKDGGVLIGTAGMTRETKSNASPLNAEPCTDGDLVRDSNGSKCSVSSTESLSSDEVCSNTQQVDSISNGTESISMEEVEGLYWSYDGFLLTLAHDIGRRLLPAFKSKTGIPYGTVNLLEGIPRHETPIASLAGSGSLTIEMELLSRLTGDEEFGKSAKLAMRALWLRRSKKRSLLGKHINVETGRWTETESGMGSNSDSFYEYLLKHYILYPEDKDFYDMFRTTYESSFKYGRQGDWYPNIDMEDGYTFRSNLFESLVAFYPGLQVLLGELTPSSRSENSFMAAREYLGFLPEAFDFSEWKALHKRNSHPLRPEIHESSYFLHMATKSAAGSNVFRETNATSSWLWAADFSLREIEKNTKTFCGYGTVDSVTPLTATLSLNDSASGLYKLQDEMPSFFLSETLKYFYLAFDSNNPLNNDKEREWIFTTEAHPIHYVPRFNINGDQKAKPKLDPFEVTKQQVIEKLSSRIFSPNKLKSQPTPISVKVKRSSRSRLSNEKWTPFTKKIQYEMDLSLVTKVKRNNTGLEAFGRVISEEKDQVLNFATLQHNKNGRGADLTKSCPNYHHQNSLWINALAGDQLAYTDLFETRLYNEDKGSEDTLPALTASALYGLSYLKKRSRTCPLSKRDEKNILENKNSNPSQPFGTQRVEMGEPLGDFDISVYNGEGFYVKHAKSGESIEATIIEKSFTQVPLVAVESYVPQQEKKREKPNLLLQSFGSSFSKLKSVFVRKKEIPKNPLKREIKYDRNIMIADMNDRSFSCKVDLIQATGETKKKVSVDYSSTNNSETATTFKSEKIIRSFPCLPAVYGPTELKLLRKSNGATYESVLYGPNEKDQFGCYTNDEGKSDKNYSNEPRIEMVLRGVCNFRSKALNLASRNNVKAAIIVNTDSKLFVMAGPKESGLNYTNEPASVLVTKEDGAELNRAILEMKQKKSKKSQLKARVSLLPMDNSDEKKLTWPQITSAENSVQILASQGWGVSAKKELGQWSLFILQHDAGGKLENEW